MKMWSRRGTLLDIMAMLCCLLCCPTPGEAFFSLGSISPTLERMANYGYAMLGYGPPAHGYDEIDLIEKAPLWNGHIPVGDIVSPILSALGASNGLNSFLGINDGYGGGYRDRVVKGFDNRLGLRVALPYVGDFQVTREMGPGRFLDKLGPGEYPYQNLPPKHNSLGGQHGGHYDDHYEPTPIKVIIKEPKIPYVNPKGTEPYGKESYKRLQNYPWYRR